MFRDNSILKEMMRMQDEMDKMFHNFFGRRPFDSFGSDFFLENNSPKKIQNKSNIQNNNADLVATNYRQPLADFFETEKDIVTTVELPGIDKKDIQINVNDNNLELKVEKKDEKKDEKKGMYRIERSYSGFYRHFSLPDDVDANKIDATYKNGVLEIKIPKNPKKQKKSKKIEVK